MRGCDLCKLNVTPPYQKITPLGPLKDKNKGKKRARGPCCDTRLRYVLCEKKKKKKKILQASLSSICYLKLEETKILLQ